MVKRQKDKQYQSAREQREHSQLRQQQQHGGGTSHNSAAAVAGRPLPFSHCALTLNPYEKPVLIVIPEPPQKDAIDSSIATGMKFGILLDNAALVQFVLQHKINPVTGAPMSTADVIPVEMHRNSEGLWQCPILTKALSDRTKIVAILQSQNKNNQQQQSTLGARKKATVYSYQAYQEFNVQAKNWTDLVTGEPFDRQKDVIFLNDPDNHQLNALRDISSFYHVRHARELRLQQQQEQQQQNSSSSSFQKNDSIQYSVTATRVMEKLQQKRQLQQQADADDKMAATTKKQRLDSSAATMDDNDSKRKDDDDYVGEGWKFRGTNGQLLTILSQDVTGVAYTTGQGAESLTSTAVPAFSNTHQSRLATRDEILQAQFNLMRRKQTHKKNSNNHANSTNKGYVRLETSLGALTVELHCDICPQTCYNFLGLCRRGKYDNTLFHRLIPNFMMQGGSSRTKKKASSSSSSANKNKNNQDVNDNDKNEDDGDCSLWGDAFPDEFDDRLKHAGPGILSMANAGPNTNQKQFFITFQSCPHLNGKHTVFGAVIDRADKDAADKSKEESVLKRMQQVPTNAKDRPLIPIVLHKTIILTDPAKEAYDMELERLRAIVQAREAKQQKQQQQQQQSSVTTTTTTTRTSASDKGDTATGTKSIRQVDSADSKVDVAPAPAPPIVGRYLKERLAAAAANKSAGTAAAAADGKQDSRCRETGNEQDATATTSFTRTGLPTAPAPPKKTTFGDFSGW